MFKKALVFSGLFLVILLVIFGAQILLEKNDGHENSLNVYFYRNEKLLPFKREFLGEAPLTEKIGFVLGELQKGPLTSELKQGVVTLMPRELMLRQVSFSEGIVSIYFNNEVTNISGGISYISGLLKQFVWTVTQFKEVAVVNFRSIGNPNQPLVIGGEGYTIDVPLGRESF